MRPGDDATPSLHIALAPHRSGDEENDPITLVFASPISATSEPIAQDGDPLTLAAPAHYPSSYLDERRDADARHEVMRAPRRPLTTNASACPPMHALPPEPSTPSTPDEEATRVDLLVPNPEPTSSREPEVASFTLATAASEVMSEIREERTARVFHSRSHPGATSQTTAGLAVWRRLLPGVVVLAAAVSGTLLGRSFSLSNEAAPRATAREGDAARAAASAESPLGSPSAPVTPDTAPVELFSVPAPHVANEAIAADAWLLGQRERGRALYEELAARAPNARAYALVRSALESRTQQPSETLATPTTLPPRNSRTAPSVEIAVIVRSRGHAHVPVRLDGELVGDTGVAGVLHLHVRAPEGRELALELDTQDAPTLLPPSPRRSVRVERASPVQSFDVTFEMPPRPATKPKTRPPQRPAPYRMN